LDKLLNFVGASKEQNNRSTKISETQRKARHEVIKRARRTKGIIGRIRQDMINNESHFSDNGNGSMASPLVSIWQCCCGALTGMFKIMNAFIKVRKAETKGNPMGNVRKINSPNSPNLLIS
jgi:hypothetical protein